MPKTSVQSRSCPNCAANVSKHLPHYSRDEWKVVACGDCEMVYLQNPADYTELVENYAWEKTYATEDEKRAKKRSFIKRLAYHARLLGYRIKGDPQPRYLKLLGAGKILDVGCGDVVRWKAPFIPFGIEISKALQSRANDKMQALGGQCLHGAGAEAIWDFPKGGLDSIMMHSYLEHEAQVSKILNGAFQALKFGGKIFIRVPNYNALNRHISGANWPGFRYPDHVNYFTVATLSSVAAKAGFDFKLVNRHKIWLDDNIQALLIKPTST